MISSLRRLRAQLAAVSALSFLLPTIAIAGVVPYPKTETAVFAFRPTTALSQAGQFSLASSVSEAVAGYPTGACVPVLVKATNNANKKGDMRLTLTYPYEHTSQIGVNNLLTINATVSGDPQTAVDHLNDFSFTTNPLSSVTSIPLDDGTSVVAQISGPYGGDNTGSSEITNAPEIRHYNLELSDMPAGKTAYILTCAQMSTTPNIITEQFSIISVKLGGQMGGNVYIAKSLTTLPPSPKLTVNTVVVNDDGGSKTTEDFSVFVNGNSVNGGTANEFSPGTYTVSGTTDADYTSVISGDCDVDGALTLSAGDNKQCTITYNDNPATTGILTVQMVIVNDNGGMNAVENFPVSINSLPVTLGTPIELVAGPYQIIQIDDEDYETVFSGDCDANGNVVVTVGGSMQCTITNNDIAPILTVTKVVVNDNGGTKTVADFPLTLNGNPIVSGNQNSLSAGSYMVTEAEDPTYAGTFSGDCDLNGAVTLSIGDVKSCTLTNDDLIPSTLTVTLAVINDNGGFNTVDDFPLAVNGDPIASGVQNLLAPGDYTISISPRARYTYEFSGDCDAGGVLSLAPQQSANCSITANDVSTGLIVITQVINDNGGTLQAPDFLNFIQAFGAPTDLIPGDENGVRFELLPGPYGVAQLANEGYLTTFAGDCFGFVVTDQLYVCTVTNDDF